MTWFNNTILPESNHHLQVLLTGIGRKKPTFYLRERTINEVLPGRLYVQPGRIDRDSSLLYDAVIYDERDNRRSRTIYADSGQMAFSPDGEDLYLLLHHGVLQERVSNQATDFQRVAFDGLRMRVAGVANDLERDTLNAYRSDREMNIGQMQEEVREGKDRVARALVEVREYGLAMAELLITGEVEQEALESSSLEVVPDTMRPDPGESDTGERVTTGVQGQTLLDSLRHKARQVAERSQPNEVAQEFANYGDRIAAGQAQINQFAVEIHKKYTIPAACIIFVLIGAPIAIRYPRGGVALVVGVGLAFFAAYYVSLVGGEELADNRIVSAFWAMWAPNVLFGLIGLGAMWRATKVTR
jgi:lipopolysaccharide export system permease protein